MDLTPLTLTISRVELNFQRQKLAVNKMAFFFEITLMRAIHKAYMKDTFDSQRKHPL